jgi:8-oxo-dGTP diphosphatase
MKARSEKPIQVTAAILESEGKILIAKRRKGGPFGGSWEFPGGRVEPGETPETALQRELREELGIETRVGELLATSLYDSTSLSIELLAYQVSYLSGKVRLADHDEIQWVAPTKLAAYDFAAPDLPIVRAVLDSARRGGSP